MQAPRGYRIVSFDYSQVEYRLIAGLIKSKHLLGLYERDADLHTATYAFCFDIPQSSITKQQRNEGKTINFALAYGMGVNHFHRKLGGKYTLDEAARIHARYFQLLPELVETHNRFRVMTMRTKSVSTYFGRYQLIPEFFETSSYARQKAERAGFNRFVQGTAADIMKLAIYRCGVEIRDNPELAGVEMVLTVHDQLLFLVPDEITDTRFAQIIRPKVELEIPEYPKFKVDFAVGQSWGSLADFSEQEATVFIPEAVVLTLPVKVLPYQLKELKGFFATDGVPCDVVLNGNSQQFFVPQTSVSDVEAWARASDAEVSVRYAS